MSQYCKRNKLQLQGVAFMIKDGHQHKLEEWAEDAFKEMDQDGDGKITINEFIEIANNDGFASDVIVLLFDGIQDILTFGKTYT